MRPHLLSELGQIDWSLKSLINYSERGQQTKVPSTHTLYKITSEGDNLSTKDKMLVPKHISYSEVPL